MPQTIVLVGHCGADSTYLRLTIKKAIPDAQIKSAEDSAALSALLENDTVDLILFNRELGHGFESNFGVDVIRALHVARPQLKMMLISNYADAQSAALAAGAMVGFGKREIGSPRVFQLLRDAVQMPVSTAQTTNSL